MFGLFSSRKKVDAVYDSLDRYLTMLSRSAERMGLGFACNLAKSSELVTEVREQRTTGREGYRFHLAEPLSDFWGTVEFDIDGSLTLSIEGFHNFQGFMLSGKLPTDRLWVSARDGISAKKTRMAESLKVRFVQSGAADLGEYT
jgi:hypothetical protein